MAKKAKCLSRAFSKKKRFSAIIVVSPVNIRINEITNTPPYFSP